MQYGFCSSLSVYMTKILSARARFRRSVKLKENSPLSKLICVDRAKTHSLITPLMGGKWHEVLSKGGFPLLRNFYVGTHVNFILTRDFPYIASILFTRVKFTCVRT